MVRFGCYMDTEKRLKYYEILERITDMTCQTENFDREAFVDCLNEFCDLFKISKGVTEFYQNVRFESQGVGEVLVDRDNGHGDIEILNNVIDQRPILLLDLAVPQAHSGTSFHSSD